MSIRWSQRALAVPTGLAIEPERGAMSRALAYLFAASAAVAAASLAVPERLEVAVELRAPLIVACAAAMVLLVGVLLVDSHLLRLRAFHLILACGTLLISSTVALSGELATGYVMLYVLVTVYAFYFFPAWQAALHVAFIGLAYGVVVLNDQAGSAPVARLLLVLGTLTATGSLIRLLRVRAGQLIAKLADAARTDVVGGLLNRRGFQEALEIELERARRGDRPVALLVGDIDGFKALNDRFGHSAGDRALERVSALLTSAKRRVDVAARIGGDEFAVIAPDANEQEAYVLAERLRSEVGRAGEEDAPLSISFGVAAFPRHGVTADELFHAGDEALYVAKALGRDRCVLYNSDIAGSVLSATSRRRAQRESYLATMLALAEALDVRETGTPHHSQAIGRYAEITARELDLPDELTDQIRIGGIVRDVGKIGVPDAVLQKPGPLTSADWLEMRRHPEISARIVASATKSSEISSWVLAHHERPDGAGYPQGLSGDEIPLEARILAVADAYEAMTSARPYRAALEPEEARERLRRAAGTQFDERVVDAFFRALDRLGPVVTV